MKQYKRDYQGIEDARGDDLAAVLNMSIESLKRTGGRSAAYADTEDGLREFADRSVEYLQKVADANMELAEADGAKSVIADVDGLCSYLGISRQTLSMYRRRSETWKDAVDRVKQAILSQKTQAANTFRIPPVLQIFDLCNNFSEYQSVNTIKVEPVTDGADRRRTPDEVAAAHHIQIDKQSVAALPVPAFITEKEQ